MKAKESNLGINLIDGCELRKVDECKADSIE